MGQRMFIAGLALAAVGCEAAAPLSGAKAMMVQTILTGCRARSATVNLVGERAKTRAAITAETIDRHAAPIRIAAGDPRLQRLTDLLKTAEVAVPVVAKPEIRLLVRIDCDDGARHVIAGSRTGGDGRIDLTIDGHPASTHAPLRRALEALAG